MYGGAYGAPSFLDFVCNMLWACRMYMYGGRLVPPVFGTCYGHVVCIRVDGLINIWFATHIMDMHRLLMVDLMLLSCMNCV